MQRRGFLGAMLAAAAAPAYVRSESLMGIFVPKSHHTGGIILGEGRLWMQPVIEKILLNSEYRAIGKFVYPEFQEQMMRAICAGAAISMQQLAKEFPPISGPANR